MNQPAIRRGGRRMAPVLAAALMLAGLGLPGCGVVNDVNKITNAVQSNKAIICQAELQAVHATIVGRAAASGTP
jgi:hypothetical protein